VGGCLEKQIPFGNDRQEKQEQEQQWILRFAQDDKGLARLFASPIDIL
jgi:hypothetical protein